MRTIEKTQRKQESINLPTSIKLVVKIVATVVGFYVWSMDFIWVVWGVVFRWNILKGIASCLLSLMIQGYLEQRAQSDKLFAPRYADPEKNIDDCITYILNYVQQSGINGFADDEIYSLALHYYDEENIEVASQSTAT